MVLKRILLYSFLIVSFVVFGQEKRFIVKGLEGFKLSAEPYVDELKVAKKISKTILLDLYNEGYLYARVDSVIEYSDSVFAFFNPNKKMKWVELHKGNVSNLDLREIDISGRMFTNRPFKPKTLSLFMERLLRYYENNGYPFVNVSLDSVRFKKEGISASLLVDKNKFYKIDSLKLESSSKLNDHYLKKAIGLKEGEAYNEEKIKNIETRISELPFVELVRKPEVRFFEEKVVIALKLKKKNASRFDGILGLLSDEKTGKVEFTGDLDLRLVNALNRGEDIKLNWRKLIASSQELNLGFSYPYLFKSDIGVGFNFDLFKQDTSFLNLRSRLRLIYEFRRGEKMELFVENRNNNSLLKNVVVGTPNISSLLGNSKANMFGVAYSKQQLDYKFNPSKGYSYSVDFSAGNRKIVKSINLIELYPNFYDSVKLKTTLFASNLNFEYYLRIAANNTILFANSFASNYAETNYQNELFRIGGLKKLRGFDEASIFASTYNISTFEYRFLLDRNSYLAVFSDIGFYEKRVNNELGKQYDKDNPIGFGAGISFETQAGIFTFNYAVGKQQGNPIEFRAAKIHFGFVSLF